MIIKQCLLNNWQKKNLKHLQRRLILVIFGLPQECSTCVIKFGQKIDSLFTEWHIYIFFVKMIHSMEVDNIRNFKKDTAFLFW